MADSFAPTTREYSSQERSFIDDYMHLETSERLKIALSALRKSRLPNLRPLLPLLLNLRGNPYTLENHFQFAPFFSTTMSKRCVWKCARQTSKSTSMAAQGTVQSATIPYFNTLFVTPLYEMIRRFSTNYVAEFIDQSPVKSLFLGASKSRNVLQRAFGNHSSMFFSFAFLDANRVRGIASDKMGIDEVQDMDNSFIPIIRETMSGSPWGIEQFTGTPKSLDNTMENIWIRSSMAEWHIPCRSCTKVNIPSLDHDLEKMIGPDYVTRAISEAAPGCVCARCSRPVFPRDGFWEHRHPELRIDFAGYHVPQIIMPMHYAHAKKWGILLGKRSGFDNTTPSMFFNEVCGESYDVGSKLVTKTELINACTERPNSMDYAKGHIGDYVHRVCSVDWGGGGEKEQSFTVCVVLGMKPDGKIDVLYAWRSRTPHDHNGEAARILKTIAVWQCSHFVHDYGGGGAIRETIMVNAGYPLRRIIPCAYIRTDRGSMIKLKRENQKTGERMHYRVDKARSLVHTCDLIRFGILKFFKYDYLGPSQAGLIHDFLALTEDVVDTRMGAKIYTIISSDKVGPDDFAQAVNIGCTSLFYRSGNWPDLAVMHRIQIDPDVLKGLSGLKEMNWEDM